MKTDPPYLYALCESSEADALNFLFDYIEDAITQDRLGDIDALYASVDWYRLPDVILVGLVRIPYLARSRLKRWAGAVQLVGAILRRRGHDAGKLLAGLLATETGAD